MTFLDPTIMGGDWQVDVENQILSICQVSVDDYFNNDRRMKASILEENLDLVVSHVRNNFSYLAYHVLGFFIIKSGAKVSEALKDEIIRFTEWEIDKKVDWGDEWVEARKVYLEDFRNKLRSHKAGTLGNLINLKFSKFPDFGTISIGLDQLTTNFETKNFDYIEHINLDTCNLFEFPDLILSFKNLKTLSLEYNNISIIPDSINRLKNLTALHLRGNKLKNIPDSIGDLKNLETINLRYNNLSTIPTFIIKLRQLKSISLQKNNILTVPESLKRLKGVYIRI